MSPFLWRPSRRLPRKRPLQIRPSSLTRASRSSWWRRAISN